MGGWSHDKTTREVSRRGPGAGGASGVGASGQYASEWAAITSIAEKSGMTAETLRLWVRQAERDAGQRPGLSSEEAEWLRRLERENKELRRPNEILKVASAFFAAELDRQPGR